MATNRPKLKFLRGSTYTFDVSNADLATHPFKFTADSGSTEYTTGVTLTGTQGQSGAEITFIVPDDAPTNLNYYCGTHGMGMGNHIFIPPFYFVPDSDGSFLSSAYRSHYDVTAALGTLYTGTSGTVYFMAVDEGVPASNDSDGTFFTDSDINVSIDSGEYLYGGGHGNVFAIAATQLAWGGNMGIFAGAYPGQSNDIDKVTIDTTGDATDFGNLTGTKGYMATASNGTIGMFAGGKSASSNSGTFNDIDYVTFATGGNATQAGSFSVTRRSHARGLYSNGYAYVVGGQTTSGGGTTGATQIDYFTLATTISSVGDFGDLTIGANNKIIGASAQDTTRGILFNTNSYTTSSSIDYLTIGGTSGNSASFGDLTVGRVYGVGLSNNTRAVYAGGNDGTSVGGANTANMKTMDYVTIQTTGNAQDFGDLDVHRDGASGSSNGTRGVLGGHGGSSGGDNSISYITIDTTGNALDFGDLVVSKNVGASGMSGNAA